MSFTLGKEEKLKSKKLIEQLFIQGKRVKLYPFQVIYSEIDHDGDFPIKFAVSVPKRNVKMAVKRIRIKRVIREIYRLNKHKISENIHKKYMCMFIFMGKEELDYATMEISYLKLIDKFLTKIKNDEE
ncbi:ribonuclease P protein component [Lutibacter oricola]|uniref:Ribonuclease P protein component n=1 Tax=Lutibacter oricola TaxID=762486 RepID=A0A1H3DEQ7_9FLAO|nr:ribonuclease P protein component [Lutibacter oricola]SDX64618.1 ribonuclease P protein component [Lutibacter oricola]